MAKDLETFGYAGGNVSLSPLPFLPAPASYSNFSQGDVKRPEGVHHHHRCSSESFLIEDAQTSWLDDLLNKTETLSLTHRGHCRSASDSCAYLGEAAEKFNRRKESRYAFAFSTESQNQESEEDIPSLAVENSKDKSNSEKPANGSQANPSGSKADSKRPKQNNAQRSRVRKLQYISHLERAVQILKEEGSEVSAQLEFIEQQNMILTMENRALRQHLESISQEHMIKHWEQGMLEREIGRLQTLYQQQKQQQMQMHHQQPHQLHNQNPKHRRNRSRDLEHQVNSSSPKNNDAIPYKASVSVPVRV